MKRILRAVALAWVLAMGIAVVAPHQMDIVVTSICDSLEPGTFWFWFWGCKDSAGGGSGGAG